MLPIAQKNPCTEGLVFPMQRSWGLRSQSSGVAASCQFNKRRFGKNNASLGAGALSLDRRCSLMIFV
jgi:hypothetical protein